MCGIAGIVSKDVSDVNLSRLKKMTDSIYYRGPDGEGAWISGDGHVALGHRRLSIIDLSTAANQPMHYMSRYTIVFNGEIYNYIELKELLVKQGYHFRTSSDTEVLMALYDKHQEKCLQLLDGQFAFSIHDDVEKKLFCARDRFGEKPFHYYYQKGRSFVYASEMKAIWAADIHREVNERMLYNYLQGGFVLNPANQSETFYKNIYRLEQSHYLLLDTQTLEMSIHRYWDINLEERNESISIDDAGKKFRELFFTSVNRRLRSDVPVGSSLSGGLDSSLVVCAIHELSKNNAIHQKTFSARFPGYEKDEGKYQQLVIDKTRADAYFTQPDGDTMLREIDKVIHHQEEPFSSSSILAQYEVFRLAKEQQVTVLLDGQGADEFLAGYHYYYQYFFLGLEKNKTEYSRQWEAYMKLHSSNPINATFNKDIRYHLRSKLPFAFNTLKKIKNTVTSNRGYLSKDFYDAYRKEEFVRKSDFMSLGGVLKQSVLGGGLQELLRYADRNSVAHSREVRLPFLNHELVEFVFTLPDTFKINQGWTKYLMRHSCKDILPEGICWRVDKIGYEPPQQKWMQKKEVHTIVEDQRRKLVANGILDASVLQQPIKPASANEKGDNSWEFWMAGAIMK